MGISQPEKSTSLALDAMWPSNRGVRFMLRAFWSVQLTQFQELHVEGQGGVGRNDMSCSASPVSELRWNGELALPSHFHGAHALIPPLDDLSGTHSKGERLLASDRTVKFLAVGQPSYVMHRGGVAPLGLPSCSSYHEVEILQP